MHALFAHVAISVFHQHRERRAGSLNIKRGGKPTQQLQQAQIEALSKSRRDLQQRKGVVISAMGS